MKWIDYILISVNTFMFTILTIDLIKTYGTVFITKIGILTFIASIYLARGGVK